MIRVFYDPRQSVGANSSFSPSAQKPAKVVESWRELSVPIEIQGFSPVEPETICRVHDKDYVKGVLDSTRPNGFGNKSPEVAKALPWVCGSMVAAASHSFKTGEATFSPTSGAHHAHFSYGSGFCTFNFLALAAVVARDHGAKKVGILDLDCHYGDGTDDIKDRLGLSFIEHYSFGAQRVEFGCSADAWLSKLSKIMNQFNECDLLLYNAGVDSHVDDPLGGVLTTEQMRLRDQIVFRSAKQMALPVATSLAGGYQKDKLGNIDPVLRLHDSTLIECDRSQRGLYVA